MHGSPGGERRMSGELQNIFLNEEIIAEKRINRISLGFGAGFLLYILNLNRLTHSGMGNPNLVSDFVGVGILLVYHSILFFFLRRGLYHRLQKYVTIFVTTTLVTVVLFGYSYGVDFVHAARSVTVSSYFLVIILSGLYHNPRIPLFAAFLAGLEYGLLYRAALVRGTPVLFEMENFRKNILTWDILSVFVLLFWSSGVLVFLASRRHRTVTERLLLSQEEQRQSEEKALYLENFDGLTRLPNLGNFRREMEGQIEKALSRNHLFALMCLGLDSFNSINQLHGTDEGDRILREVGLRMKAGYREGDYICRFMGDKFLVLFADLASDGDISDLIRKTRQIFLDPFELMDGPVRLTAGGGLCTFPADGDNPEDLIIKAESAMYDAKRGGKDSFVLFDRINQEELERCLLIEKELGGALENREFRVVYQPKVDSSGAVVGMEALVRWNSARLGAVSPEVFIPLAEKTGVIVPLGYEVLRLCCLQIRRWEESGVRRFRTTVNVSPHQVGQKNFVDQFCRIIRDTGVDPGWLGIEITESGIMRNEADSIEKLTELKDFGLIISIDDFGKGYSSLSRLGTYPLDTLKIDKAFVDGLPDSRVSRCLVRSVVDLAGNLDYRVVAEGVERREQVDFLLEIGCRYFQGYYFFRPMEPEELEDKLPRNSASSP